MVIGDGDACDFRKRSELGNLGDREVSKEVVDSLGDRLALSAKNVTGDPGPRYPRKSVVCKIGHTQGLNQGSRSTGGLTPEQCEG